MMVVVQIDSSYPLTILSMTLMISINEIFLVYFVTNIGFALSLNSYFKKETKCVGRLTEEFGF
jgi:hypothetical protein